MPCNYREALRSAANRTDPAACGMIVTPWRGCIVFGRSRAHTQVAGNDTGGRPPRLAFWPRPPHAEWLGMSIIDLKPIQTPVRVSIPQGLRCVSTAIGAWGEAIRLSVPADIAEAIFGTEEQPGGASFPKTHTGQAYTATVSITTGMHTILRQLPAITATYPLVQTLPEDDILVVAPRCPRFSDGTHEQNAKVTVPTARSEPSFAWATASNMFRQTGRVACG
jgi:hypothetical protein